MSIFSHQTEIWNIIKDFQYFQGKAFENMSTKFQHLVQVPVCIYVTSHERHLLPYFRSLAAWQLVEANNELNIKALFYWPFVRGIQWWPVDSPHKGPMIWKAFPCHVAIGNNLGIIRCNASWVNTLRSRKMAAIFQTTFSNAFSSMKMYEFWLTFHWSLFLGVQLTIFHHWFR